MRILHGEEVQRVDVSDQPLPEKGLEWWFTACSPYGDERHDLCPGDITLRNDYHGSCVCPCHKV